MDTKATEYYYLNELMVEGIDGKKEKIDLSKEVATMMFNEARTLELHLASQELYKDGKCEKSEAVAEFIKNLSEQLVYRFKVAILDIIK